MAVRNAALLDVRIAAEIKAMLIAKKVIPAPEGEDYRAYNAAVIAAITTELIPPLERERLQKILWARLLVNELLQRIAKLRALHEAAATTEREACVEIALSIDSGRGNEKEIAAAIRARAK